MFTTKIEIDEFIDEYKRSRVIIETSVRASLNRALEFETEFQKPFYEFTEDEVLQMYKSAHAISDRSLQNSNLTLKHAARWMLYNKNLEICNIYESITKELIQECVDVNKKKSLILTQEDLINIQNELLNWTDKGILLMLFLGAGSNWLKELTFFDISQVSRNDGKIYFKTGKMIPITEADYELIRRACNEDELMSFGTTSRISKVVSHGFFKQRFNALSANDNIKDEQDLERRFRFIQRRLMLISNDLGVQLNSSGLQTSGLLHYLKLGVRESGMTLKEYVKTDEAKILAKRYDIYSEFAPQILLEKFEQYF